MVGNEMFLDTAIQRESVLSKAKELGYELVDHRLELYGVPIKDKK